MRYDINGNKVTAVSPTVSGESCIFDATKVIGSRQFYFTGANASAYGTYGQVIECKIGDVFYWNGTFATNGSYKSPVMLSGLPNAESIYDTSVTVGETLTANENGGYTAMADGAIFFPIIFTNGSNSETYFANGLYGAYIIQNVPIDRYYAMNYAENYVVNTNPSPLMLSGILKNYIPLIGAKVAVLGDSLSEQSAGYKAGRDNYGYYDGDYNSDGWFSRIARKYNMTYKVHGYGMQWWYCTSGRPNGGVKAVKSLIESGYIPDYIVLEYGTNDIWSGTLGEATDVADETATSTVGAMRYCIETLQSTFPAAKIIVIMPCMRNGRDQETYYNLITPILKEYGVRRVDMAHNSGIVAAMMNSDGVHLATVNADNSYNNATEAVARFSRCLETELLKL